MASRHLRTIIRHLLEFTLSLATTGAGLWAEQPPAKQEAKSGSSEQPQRQKEQAPRTDLYGDPLPQGAVARLGTVRLRAIGAQVGLSPDGKTIVTVAGEMLPLIKIFDVDTGKLRERRELPGVSFGEPLKTYLSPDGRLLAVQESDSGALDIRDISTGKQRYQLRPRKDKRIGLVVFSPNGKSLAAVEGDPGGNNAVLRVWNIASNVERELKGCQGLPKSIAFSADGKLLAASDPFHHVMCYDVEKSKRLWRVESRSYGPLAFAPDGRTVIAAPGDFYSLEETPPKNKNRLKMWRDARTWDAWDAATGKLARGVKLPEDFGTELAVAADNRTLVFVPSPDPERHRGVDCRVRFWDLQTGRQIRRLDAEGHIGPFFPDGKSFLTNSGVLQRWDLATGRPLLPATEKMGHGGEIICAVYCPDGRRLASSARDGTISLWDVATAKPLHILRGHEADDLAFTPDGKHLVSGPNHDELYVWNTETGQKARRVPLPDRSGNSGGLFWRLQLSSDGRMATVAGYGESVANKPSLVGVLTRWDLTTGKRTSRVEWEHQVSKCDAFSPDGLLLASYEGLLDTATGKIRVKLEGEGGQCYAFSPDGRLVTGIVLTRDIEEEKIDSNTNCLAIVVWDTKSGRALHHIPIPVSGEGPLAFSPDRRYLAAAGMKDLRVWELATGRMVLRHKAHERTLCGLCGAFTFCLSFAPDGRTLATGDPDSTVLIWNLAPSIGPATAKDLPRLWEDLAGSDAAKAYSASWRFADAPDETIRFLRERLRPITPAPAAKVRQMLVDLNSDEYPKREAATMRLRELGERAVISLREGLKARPSLEVRLRVKNLLKLLEEPQSGGLLRQLRAVAILERIGTLEAQQILKALAEGMPEARVTREAKESLERMRARRLGENR